MKVSIKSSHYFNKEENQDYTFIFDSESNLPIFISNTLLAELGNKALEEKEEGVFLQIINNPNNGTFSQDNIENGIFIRTEDEFKKTFDCS